MRWPALTVTGVMWFSPAMGHAGSEIVILRVDTAATSTSVAGNRLEQYLMDKGCHAQIVFDQAAEPDLAFRVTGGSGEWLLTAVNRDGTNPVPVWVTRKSSGVRSLSELQGRDVSLVAGADPVGGQAALKALADHGVLTARGQRYEAADYSSALGLLLHNNTHAAVSELGFVRPFLEPQGLELRWQGEPISGAGWYQRHSRAIDEPGVRPCLTALADLRRTDDRQIFQIFPEWVSGFAVTHSQH